MISANENLQEKRQQGTITFPCTLYRADYRLAPDSAPFWAKTHWHNAVEILHFEQGNFRLALNMKQFDIASEAFCFVESGTLHSIRCERGYLEQAVVFDASVLSASNVDEAEQEIIYPLTQRNLALPVVVTAAHPAFNEVREEFAKIYAIFEMYGRDAGDQRHITSASKQLRIKASIMNMLAALQESGSLTVQNNTAEDPRIEALKEVLSFIRRNYAEKIYLKDLAEIMNMNEQYFCRFFKKLTGKSPITYINEVRIRNASLLLQTTQKPVTQIAMECGYGNMGHFITQFRKINGVSPLHMRTEAGALK